MLLARELPGIEIPELFLPHDIPQAKEMIEKAAFLGFAVCDHCPGLYITPPLIISACSTQNGNCI